MPASEKDYGDERIAARILLLRQKSALSMDAFAALLGVSQPTQSRIERAKRLPDALYLRALRERFGIDINALLDEGDELAAPLDPGEQTLLDNYRHSTPADQAALKAASGARAAARAAAAGRRKAG